MLMVRKLVSESGCPIDPMTGKAEWGMHSMEDDPESDSWDGKSVWDVYTTSQDTGLDGSRYREW